MRLSTALKSLAIALLGLATAGAVCAQDGDAPATAGDAQAGRRVFAQCSSCHSLDPGQIRQGPHLAGLWGRTAGTVDGYRYSKALMESGIVWNDETLAAFIANPRAYVPGTTMSVGVRREADILNLLAYLRDATAIAE